MPFDKLFFCFLPLTESRFIISERGPLKIIFLSPFHDKSKNIFRKLVEKFYTADYNK